MFSKDQLEFIKTNTLIALLIVSIFFNAWLVRYVLDQNAATILKQEDILRDYRNNYILSKKIEERSEKINQ